MAFADCTSLTSCKNVERIIKVLQLNATFTSNDAILQYFNQSYSNLLNDYQHILNCHLNQFKLLYQYIIKYINCDIKKCKQYRRNNRIREKDNDKQYGLDKYDKEAIFYINIIDTIHCLLLHSYDQGFRLNVDEIKYNEDNEDNHHNDKELNKITKYLKNKRKKLREIDGYNERIQNNKFMTKLITDDSYSKFNFGQRFYYWDYHKNNNQEDIWCNIGYTYNQYYVNPYYSDFKAEIINILNNKHKYDDIIIKSNKYMISSNYIKQLKSKDCDHITLEYGIKANSKINIYHIMSIILYTDYTEYSYNFSKSFRENDKNESIESIKKRNSKYFFWSKYLRELVEGYGSDTYPENTNIKEFYHGTSYLLFPQMIAKFKGPTSTSSQMEVAVIFSSEHKNGIILSLKNRPCGVPVEFFNCQFLSAYSHEQEALFFGGRVALQIHTIRLLNNDNIWENYSYFVKSLAIFDGAISGNVLIGSKLTKTDNKIIDKLIQQKIYGINENNNHFPCYICQLFNLFCNERRRITIDLKYLNDGYPLFKKQLISPKNDNLLALNNIIKIYQNIKVIFIRNAFGSKLINIDHNYLSLLFEEISNIKYYSINKSLKLIKIVNPNIDQSIINDSKYSKFKLKIVNESYYGSDKKVLEITI